MVFFGSPGGPSIVQVGWWLTASGMVVQVAYFLQLTYPTWKRPLTAILHEIPITVLLVSQGLLILLSSLLPPFQTIFAIALLSSASGWHFRLRHSYRRGVQIFRELGELIDTFAKIGFEPNKDTGDPGLVGLLETGRLNISGGTSEQNFSTEVTWIGNAYLIFHSWLSGIRHKVDLVVRSGGKAQESDMIATVEEFVSLYNSFMDRVLEGIVRLAGKAEPEGKRMVRIRFSVVRDGLAELRYKLNNFLKELRKDGFAIWGETTTLVADLG